MKDHDKVMIEVRPSQIDYLMSQMDTIVHFFNARDKMNADVHLAEVRWSPITVAAQEVRDALGELWADATKALARQ